MELNRLVRALYKPLIPLVAATTIFTGCVNGTPTPTYTQPTPTTNITQPTPSPTQTVTPKPNEELDTDNDGYSDRFEKDITKTDPSNPNDRYAILVGVYDSEVQATTEPSSMNLIVNQIYDLFTNKLDWKKENIIKLLYEEATFSNFQKAIDQVVEKADENDLVYIALTGHGVSESFRFQQPPSIGYSKVDRELDKINSRVLIVDIGACQSGGAIKYMKDGPCPRIVITSSTENETTGRATSGDIARALGQGEWGQYFAAVADGELVVPSGYDVGGRRLGNQDGYVSLKEAFEEAMFWSHGKIDKPSYPEQSPQIYDPNEMASEIFLGEYKLVDIDKIQIPWEFR